MISSVLSEPSKEFDSLEHLRNYVAKAVLNRAIQAKRRSNRRETWTESIEVQFAVSPETLESEETQKMRTLREGIDRLSRNEYEIVKLRFYFGLTFREISEKLDVPISTLKSREDAAVKKIRVHLRKKGF
ncbi:MAG: RNA polymerase sigma factor [Bacteroidota bacterium]